MIATYYLLPAILTIILSLLIVRAGAIALMLTGLPLHKARFQALSAFTGTGFTTRETESVVNHPTRRRIVSILIILGHAGVVTVIITATTSLLASPSADLPVNMLLLLGGAGAAFLLWQFTPLDRLWERFVLRRLESHPAFEDEPVEELLHMGEGYALVQVTVHDASPLNGHSLDESGIEHEGLLLLGVQRGQTWLPAPSHELSMKEGDRFVVYGPLHALRQFERQAD